MADENREKLPAQSENRDRLRAEVENVESLRAQIDRINLQILALVNERLALSLQIQAIKIQKGLPLFDREREKAMIEKLRRANPGPLSDSALESFFLPLFRLSLEGKTVENGEKC